MVERRHQISGTTSGSFSRCFKNMAARMTTIIVGTDCKYWQYAAFWRLLRRAQKSRAMPACLALYATDETLMPSQSCPPRSPEPVAPAAPCAKRSRGLTCMCYAVGLLLVFILSLLLLPHDRGLGRLLWGTL